MQKIHIRTAKHADIPKIAQFNVAMALETEELVLDHEKLLRGVKAVLEDSQKGFYLVAEVNQQVRACLMITTEWSDWRNGQFWWIQSVYVEKEYRKQGLFKALYSYVLARVESNSNSVGLRLYVEKENLAAQKTYKTLGMHKTGYFLYEYCKPKGSVSSPITGY